MTPISRRLPWASRSRQGQSFHWQGNAPTAQAYYATVRSNFDSDAQYLLNISSPGLAAEQPGLAQPTPEPPTPLPTPTVDPNVTLTPTSTPLPNITVVPVATPDPNVAVVTAAASMCALGHRPRTR